MTMRRLLILGIIASSAFTQEDSQEAFTLQGKNLRQQ